MSEDGRPEEAWTPVQVEAELSRLMNEVAQAELAMRKLLIQEADARLAYERAHVIAATHPECPVVSTSPRVTVGERESWIRGVVEDEFAGLEYAELNVKLARNYERRLEQQCSLVQTRARMVSLAYQIVGARGTGGY